MKKHESHTKKIKTIFSGIGGKKHILHLYVPTLDKYAIQSSFLGNKKEKAAYVSTEQPETVHAQLDSSHKNLSIISPKEMETIENYNKIIIDAGSISSKTIDTSKKHKRKIGEDLIIKECTDHIKREKYLSKLKGDKSILCTYDISKLTPNKIRQLVKVHDQLILTTDDTAVVSSKTLSQEHLNISSELIDEFLKNELETVVLALIVAKPRCGTEIKKAIHKKFGILLSSGTLYPLLHKLQKNDLVKCEYGVKTKTYRPANGKDIQIILDERMKAKDFLTSFIQANMGGNKKWL
ncbi:MAG: PadR family transcriptional regulator [Candidatus Diapherotrites archaeon]